uniref:Uncharacterized protein n=1 Tax=Arundo donax TaxID=35708 RepID=A0A0A8YRA5_ARUDO
MLWRGSMHSRVEDEAQSSGPAAWMGIWAAANSHEEEEH